MLRISMSFYVTKTSDGLLHVQNYVMGHKGQHHVHTEKGFKKWLNGLSEAERLSIHMNGSECQCGLGPGDVKEYDGRQWHKKEFE